MLCTLANGLRGWVAQKALHAHTCCGTLMPWGPLEDQKSPQGPPLLPWLLMVSERGKTETNISWVPLFCKAPHKIPHSLRVRHFHPYFRVERNEAEKVQKSCSRPRNWWLTDVTWTQSCMALSAAATAARTASRRSAFGMCSFPCSEFLVLQYWINPSLKALITIPCSTKKRSPD